MNYRPTQENYAIQDSSGKGYLMPQGHLPEWRKKEEERAFVNRGSLKPNKDLDNTVLPNVNCIIVTSLCIEWRMTILDNTVLPNVNCIIVTIEWRLTIYTFLFYSMIDFIRCNRTLNCQCTNDWSSSSCHFGRCRCGIKWQAILSGIISSIIHSMFTLPLKVSLTSSATNMWYSQSLVLKLCQYVNKCLMFKIVKSSVIRSDLVQIAHGLALSY